MKYALRGVGGSDNIRRLDLAYYVEDPWNMDSDRESRRFQATNRIIEHNFGRVGSLLELGCGEGHQTQYLARLSDQQYGIDVSAQSGRARDACAFPPRNSPRPICSTRPGKASRHASIWSPPAKCSTT